MSDNGTAPPGEINGDMFDRFSLLHAGFGYICGKAGVGLTGVSLLAIAWEFAERDLKKRHPSIFPHPSQDSPANAVGDVIIAIAAWSLARKK